MSSPAGGGAVGGGRGGAHEEKRTSQLTPLSVRQALSATFPAGENKPMLGNFELRQVTLVGHVLSAEVTASHVEYTLDDGTDYIVARMFNTNTDESAPPDVERIHTYVRMFGNIRPVPNDRNTFMVFKVVTVTDHNEVTFHTLDVATTIAKIEKGMHLGVHAPSSASSASSSFPGASSASSFSASSGSVYGSDVGFGVASSHQGNMTPAQALVLNTFKQFKNQDGIRVEEIARMLAGKLQEREIRDCISYLSDEGHLFSTTDEETYMST